MDSKKLILFGIIALILVTVIVGTITGLFSLTTKDTIKIGVAVPISGEVASWGNNALAGITLATNEINTKGGINGKTIELIVEDTKCNSESVKAYEKLINVDDVTAILGLICSSEATPALPLARDAKIPNIILTASAPELTSISDYIFRVYPSDNLQGKFAAEYIYNKLGKRKVAVIYLDNSWGNGLYSTFQNIFKELGGEIVYSSKINQNETNVKSDLLKIKNTDAEILYLPVYPTNILSVFKSAAEEGLNLQIIAGDATSGEEVVSSGLGEGSLFMIPKFNLPFDFESKIKSQDGFDNLQVSFVAPLGYDAARVLYDAISKVGLDKERIKDALAQTNYKGISNPIIQFDSVGDITSAQFEVKLIKNKEAINYNK